MLPWPLPAWRAEASADRTGTLFPWSPCRDESAWVDASAPDVTDSAAFSSWASSPAAICWTRKTPSTATTAMDTTRVVPITRSCSDRCQRRVTSPVMDLARRRASRSSPRGAAGSRSVSSRAGPAPATKNARGPLACPLSGPAAASGRTVASTAAAPKAAAARAWPFPDALLIAPFRRTLSRAGGPPPAPYSQPGRRSGRPRLVAHPAHRDHDLRALGVFLDLGPEPLHVHVDQPGVRRVPVAPDLLKEHLAGEDLARLPGQRHQQVELQRGEVDRRAVPLDRVARHVDGDVPDLQHLGNGVLGPAQPGANA